MSCKLYDLETAVRTWATDGAPLFLYRRCSDVAAASNHAVPKIPRNATWRFIKHAWSVIARMVGDHRVFSDLESGVVRGLQTTDRCISCKSTSRCASQLSHDCFGIAVRRSMKHDMGTEASLLRMNEVCCGRQRLHRNLPAGPDF